MKRGMVMVNRCIMCKNSEEILDHLLLHILKATELWDFIFVAFGMKWVLPKMVKGLFQCCHVWS